MRWRGGRRSTNVEDRRGMRAGPAVAGGGIGMVILALIAMALGADPSVVLQTDPVGSAPASHPVEPAGGPPTDEMGQFVAVVLADTEDTWAALFGEMGESYQEPVLVLFNDAVQSACGFTQAAVGPFYCPARPSVVPRSELLR